MFFDKYTKSAYASRFVIVLMDMTLVALSIFIATLLRLNFDLPLVFDTLPLVGFFVLAVRLASFRWFKTYAVIVRFAGSSDVLQVASAVVAGTLFLLGLSIVLKPQGVVFSMAILLIEFFLTLTMLSALRLMMPSLFNILYNSRESQTNVIIIGGGNLGSMTRNIVRQDASRKYNLVGIIDDNRDIHKKYLDGVPVYLPSELKDLIKSDNVEIAIFAIKKISFTRKNELVDLCIDQGLKVLDVPYSENWQSEEVQISQLKEIKIEDLLSRTPIMLEKAKAHAEIHNKVVLITGAAGSIGSELVRQIIQFDPKHLYVLDQAETPIVNLGLEIKEEFGFDQLTQIVADVSDEIRMRRVFERCQPQIVFHAAAYKHVPIMESYPREALKVNVLGTKILADLSKEYNVSKFVMVSTDKAVNPTNVMGATKRIAEMYVQSLDQECDTQYITTRFGNVLGSNGSVVPRFQKQIREGGPITVTHPDITRYFMTIPEASQLVIEAGAMGNGGELFLFDMGEPVKILALAERIVKLSGLKPHKDIEIKFTGLRPGEKLYEELLTTNENSILTHHPKITKAKTQNLSRQFVEDKINEIKESLDRVDDMALVGIMKQIVPEFISNNSQFDKLDKVVKGKGDDGRSRIISIK